MSIVFHKKKLVSLILMDALYHPHPYEQIFDSHNDIN